MLVTQIAHRNRRLDSDVALRAESSDCPYTGECLRRAGALVKYIEPPLTATWGYWRLLSSIGRTQPAGHRPEIKCSPKPVQRTTRLIVSKSMKYAGHPLPVRSAFAPVASK